MTTPKLQPWRSRMLLMTPLLACKPAAEGPTEPASAQRAAMIDDDEVPTSLGAPASASSISFTGSEAMVAAKRAFVQETCGRIVAAGDPDGRRCEAMADLGEWILLRSSDAVDDGMRWWWFVGVATTTGFILMAPDDVDLPPYNQDPVDVIYSLCLEVTATDDPPVDSGLINVGVIDVTQDGRPDLVFECQETGTWGEHYLRTCAAGDDRCTSRPMPSQ
jgi:hypothetical protein